MKDPIHKRTAPVRDRGPDGRRVRPMQVLLGITLICLMVGVELLLLRAQASTRRSSDEFRRTSLAVTTLANIQRETLRLSAEVQRISAGETDLDALELQRQILERQLRVLRSWKVPQHQLTPIYAAVDRFDSYAHNLSQHAGTRKRDVATSGMAASSEVLEQRVKDLYDSYEQRFLPELGRDLEDSAASQHALLVLGMVVMMIAVTLALLIRRSVRSDFRTAYDLLSQLESKYRNFVEKVPAVVYAADFGPEGRWHFVSPQIKSILGFSADEWMADPELWYKQLHPDDRNAAIEQEQRARATGERLRSEYRLLARDGRVVWLRDEAVVVEDDDGSVLMEGLMLDISETKKSQDEREESLSLLQATLESTADGILVVSAEGNIINFNETFAEMWDLPEDVLASRDDDRALAVAMEQLRDPEEFLAKVKDLYAHADAESFDVIEFKDGRVFERLSKPQRVGDKTVGRVWSFRDVTERVRSEEERQGLERQLNQAQKMEAVGQLAGGVAHDFNNLLSVVINYARFALEDSETGGQLKEDLAEIVKAGERGATLTRQLLTFSRKAVHEPEVVNVNDLVSDMNKMLSRMIPEVIQVHAELDPDLKPSRIDPAQFEQVLMNLAINAKDAMPTGGELKIATRNLTLVGAAAEKLDLPPGDYVALDVTDTGHGIPEDLMPRIFEPFFTTKDVGQGTGLGLAVVYGIVKKAGGHLAVTSKIGHGCHFCVYLPALITAPEAQGSSDHQGGNLLPGGGESILVAEDEAAVMSVVERILSTAGYRVVACGSPVEALDQHAERLGEIDLLLTDVVMPEMSGRELSERTGLPTVFMSGYADSFLPEVEFLSAQGHFIDKPFTKEKVLEAVHAAIGDRSFAAGSSIR